MRELIEAYAEEVTFSVPELALAEGKKYLPTLIVKHNGEPEKALAFLEKLGRLMELIGSDIYVEFEEEARKRLTERDAEDWPILAAALALGCPIWTENTDFFGFGNATWTSCNVRTYLSSGQK